MADTPTNATTPEGQAAYEQYIMAPMQQATAIPSLQQAINPFPPTIAAPGNEANLATGPVPLSPLDPWKNIGGAGDVMATMDALKKNVAEAAPVTPSPEEFAQPTEQPMQQAPAPIDMSGDSKALENTINARQKATTAIANAASDKAVADMKIQEGLAKELEKKQLEAQARQIQFDNDYKEKTKYLDSVADEMKSQDFTAPKVNGTRFWESQTTGGKILAGIAVALGGIGGAMTGKGGNVGLDMVNKAIDRDIDEQKFNAERTVETQKMKSQNLRDRAGIGENMLMNLRQKFQSDVAAETALRTLMVQQAQTKLAAIASQYDSPAVKEKAKFMNAELEQQKIALGMTLKQQMAQQNMARQLAVSDISQLTPMQMQQMGMSKETMDSIVKTQERTVSGWQGIVPDKEAAAKFREKAGELQPAIDSITRIKGLTRDFSKITDMKKRAQIETEVASLVGALRLPITGPGILTDSERKMLETIIGDPTKIVSMPEWQKARMDQIQKKLTGDLNSTAQRFGLKPINSAVKKYLTPVK